jgi:hypothetical protein
VCKKIFRQDVIKVISAFNIKAVETSTNNLHKRLEKHFSSAEAQVDLDIVEHIKWSNLYCFRN